jgi:predicted nucleic acid-binding protein
VIVIDASVAVKLYRHETGSDLAYNLLEAQAGQLLAPDIFAVEVAGSIVRDANSDKQTVALQSQKLAHFTALLGGTPLELVPMTPEAIFQSAGLAIQLGHPLKDCLYLALAMDRQCPMVTADVRFASKARSLHGDVRALAEGF